MKDPHLDVALQAAAAAGRIIRKAFLGKFKVRYKADASPVTDVDIAAEAVIKKILRRKFHGHGFHGEESGFDRGAGASNTANEYVWLVDPIDGTKSFVRGYPMFSVQIALMRRGELVLGVSHAPCWGKGETLHAVKGAGAWRGTERLRVSDVSRIDQATLSTGNLATLADSPGWERLGELVPKLNRVRGYGDFLHYHYLAAGKIEAVVESDVNILDIAALAVIVREAGGTFTDLSGAPVGPGTRSVLATNGNLHDTLRKALAHRPLTG
ncbi:MAG: inositol monophosphatase family protein [Gammaproteobacteria bacterium]